MGSFLCGHVPQVAGCAKDSAEVVEGIAGMGLAMRFAAPTQVALTSAKETAEKMEGKKAAEGNKVGHWGHS
jgi:hypothetical protein